MRMAMDALGRSDELLQRGAELRARSNRACAAAGEQMEDSRRLIAAATKARQAVMRAHGWAPPRRGAALLPATGRG